MTPLDLRPEGFANRWMLVTVLPAACVGIGDRQHSLAAAGFSLLVPLGGIASGIVNGLFSDVRLTIVVTAAFAGVCVLSGLLSWFAARLLLRVSLFRVSEDSSLGDHRFADDI